MIKNLEGVASESSLITEGIKAMQIKNYCVSSDAYHEGKTPNVSDMAEYSCDAECDNCHCATF